MNRLGRCVAAADDGTFWPVRRSGTSERKQFDSGFGVALKGDPSAPRELHFSRARSCQDTWHYDDDVREDRALLDVGWYAIWITH